jgi:hypothetical protein
MSWWQEGSLRTVDAPSPQGDSSTRYLFDSWSDAGPQAHVVVTSAPMTLVANFRTQFHLRAQSPYGAVSCDVPSCWYNPDVVATFSVSPSLVDASPGTRYAFTGWLGDSNATSSSASITMNMPHVVDAAWVTQYELTVGSPHGTTVGAGWHDAKSNATFSVSPSIVDGTPGTRYLFEAWTGDSTTAEESANLTMDGPRGVTARWGTEHSLTVVSPYGVPAGSGWYRANADAPFSITPAVVSGPTGTRYAFESWTGDSTATSATSILAMDAPRSVAASWRTEYELTIDSEYGTPEGAGWHRDGTTVTVSIESEVTVEGIRYRFVGWTGDEVGPNPVLTTAMDRPKRIEAIWEEVVVAPRSELRTYDWLVWLLLLAVILFLVVLFAWRRRRKEEVPPPPPPID